MISPDGAAFCAIGTLLPGFDGDLVDMIAAAPELPHVTHWTALDGRALLAPIPAPRRNVFCVGKNYHEHAKEFANSGFDTSAAKGEMAGAHALPDVA